MIRIRKPATPPEVLRARGARARRKLCSAYSRARQAYREGLKLFSFDAELYAHPSVQEALRRVQHGKCAFCESKLGHISYGDVEHFRPKGGWRQREDAPLQRPGYYWLAYEWSNLLLCCTLCNQRFKKNLFPLGTPSQRAYDHTHDIAQEDALLLDPSQDDPEAFLSFREEVPYSLEGNARGEATITLLGLRREALMERRRDALARVKSLVVLSKLQIPEAEDARKLLYRLQQDDAEYAAMIRAFLREEEAPGSRSSSAKARGRRSPRS